MNETENNELTIVGKNGAYIIKDGNISLVTETKNIKGKMPINHKFLKAIKDALEKSKS